MWVLTVGSQRGEQHLKQIESQIKKLELKIQVD
jgi:hypothetical protein